MRLIILTLCVLLAACANNTPLYRGDNATSYVYHLGAGDRMKITTYNEDRLSGEFAVDGEGIVSFPLIGKVQAGGMTLDAFRESLQSKLASQYLRNAKVAVELLSYRPVYILGEVNKPGQYAYTDHLSVYALVAEAGGFTYRADSKRVFIRHENEAGAERGYVMQSGTAVRPGDTVRIAQRYF